MHKERWWNESNGIIKYFPTYSTEQNPQGCCDGYMWDSDVDNCVGIFTYIHSNFFTHDHFFLIFLSDDDLKS